MPGGSGEKFGGSGGPGLISLTEKEHEDHRNPVAEVSWKIKILTDLNDLLEKVNELKNEQSQKIYVDVIGKAMFAVEGVTGLSSALDKIEAANGSGIRQEYQKNLKVFLAETKTFVELAIAEEKEKEGK